MGCELRDRTLGIVGLGGIGKEVVRLLAGFGMHPPIAFDPYIDQRAAEKLGVRLVELDALLKEADFVSIHCPLNQATRNLIGTEQIALMKPGAYLLNTARGGIVDEDALHTALKDNRIAGAALDCFVDEPVTKPHRFSELDNVLLAPHLGYATGDALRNFFADSVKNVAAWMQGEPINVLNEDVLPNRR